VSGAEPAAAYRSLRARVTDLAAGIDGETANTTVPATPEWSVHDLLAHLAGVPNDIISGQLEGIATDPWTQVQVDARRARSVAELLTEWEEFGSQVDALIPAFPPEAAAQLVFDASTHEQDLRHALGAPGAREPVASVRTTRFEVFRGTTGRRSAAEIASWAWDGDPRPDLLVISPPFTMRSTDLDE
jgi:hypothetical protein